MTAPRYYTRYEWEQAWRYARYIRSGKPKHYEKVRTFFGIEEVCVSQTAFLVPTRLAGWAFILLDKRAEQWPTFRQSVGLDR